MVKKTRFTAVHGIMLGFLGIFTFSIIAQESSVSKVPVTTSTLVSTSACFNGMSQHTFEVGKEVASLSGSLTFCSPVSVTNCCGKPARIVLVLDASGSMCQEVTDCAGASMNDPTNRRIDAANVFVDSLAARCSLCEIGVIIYTGVGNDSTGMRTITQDIQPVRLDDVANIAALHTVINSGRCSGRMGKTERVEKLAKRALTFTGLALDSAIKMVDGGFDTLQGMNRHIILLTDGDWQKPTTSQILASYAAGHPGRKMPVIHGVFISDSAWHVANGFPPFGMATCNAADSVPMDMSNLQLAASATGGLYFPGSTPQTIVATFLSLLTTIADNPSLSAGLASVTFTNQNTGEKRVAAFQIDSTFPMGGRYRVSAPGFDLTYGPNPFIASWVVQDTNGVRVTTCDTFIIIRKTTSGTATNPVFLTESGVDTVGLSIHCAQAIAAVGAFDTVTIGMANALDTTIFKPKNIIVRAFVPFPDDGDGRTLALFHFDSNFVNNAPNGKPGTVIGMPRFSGIKAFGTTLNGTAFSTALASDIQGDFTFECWIKPTVMDDTVYLLRGTGLNFMVNHGYLSAAIGNASIRMASAVDLMTWQHVAFARQDGIASIYVNGIPRTAGVSASSPISGTLIISDSRWGVLDEVRLSACVRTSEIQGTTVLQIPCSENLQWKIGAATSDLPSATLPSSLWQGVSKGSAQFQVTSLVPGPVIINFLDMLSSPSFIWSVNGDPITFGTNGSPVKHSVHIMRASIDPELKVFDARGKLLKTGTKDMLRSKAFDLQGVYFVKYRDGRIERRMNLAKYGNSGR